MPPNTPISDAALEGRFRRTPGRPTPQPLCQWVWACAWRCFVGWGRLLSGCALRSSPAAFGALQMDAVGWGRAIHRRLSDAMRIQPLPSICIGHVRCTGRDAHAAGLPLHLSNCWSLSDRHQPLCGLRWLACAPKHAVFLMRLSRAASGAQQADQRRNRYARGCGRVHGVAPWAGGGCYAAVPSDQALMPSVHSK